jgi:hypothetical protein
MVVVIDTLNDENQKNISHTSEAESTSVFDLSRYQTLRIRG